MSNSDAIRRSEARERRRATARTDENGADDTRGGLESAARAAAAAAAVGAALGAMKALAGRDDEQEHEDAPTATEDQTDEDDERDESDDDDEQTQEAEDAQQQQAAPEASEDEQPAQQQPRERQQNAAPSRPREGASSGTVRSIAAQAREQLRELQGREAESVTALERIDDGWRVTCEVVEVERIPNSTDVLATYVLELDGDGELITFERVRRYYRAQADLGGER